MPDVIYIYSLITNNNSMEIERFKIGKSLPCPYGMVNITGIPYIVDSRSCRTCICYRGSSDKEVFCGYQSMASFLNMTLEKEDVTKLLADKYVLDQNFNDKLSNEDWEQFTARKMRDAFMAGYKEGKESK